MEIILGSQSRGRKKMLEEMRLFFTVMPADIDEKAFRHNDPKELVRVLAHAKADALTPKISEPAILITSDQVAVWNGKIREKPESAEEAKEFLRGYNNHPVDAVTGVVVVNTKTGKRAEAVDVATVHFRPFSESDIEKLVAEGDVFNYAGGCTIDGKWKRRVKKIEGVRDSVIGLPKDITRKLIEEVQ